MYIIYTSTEAHKQEKIYTHISIYIRYKYNIIPHNMYIIYASSEAHKL
jgi:hypothetical protein